MWNLQDAPPCATVFPPPHATVLCPHWSTSADGTEEDDDDDEEGNEARA